MCLSLIPIQRATLPGVNEADHQYRDEDQRLDETENSQMSQLDRPRIEKNHLDIEEQEQDRGQVKAHRESAPCRTARRVAALERLALGLTRARGADQHVNSAHQADD